MSTATKLKRIEKDFAAVDLYRRRVLATARCFLEAPEPLARKVMDLYPELSYFVSGLRKILQEVRKNPTGKNFGKFRHHLKQFPRIERDVRVFVGQTSFDGDAFGLHPRRVQLEEEKMAAGRKLIAQVLNLPQKVEEVGKDIAEFSARLEILKKRLQTLGLDTTKIRDQDTLDSLQAGYGEGDFEIDAAIMKIITLMREESRS